MGWVPALAALAGSVVLVRRRDRAALLLVPTAIAFLLIDGTQSRFFGRWLLPIFPICFVLAGYAGVVGARALARGRERLVPAATAVVALALCAQGLIYVIHSDRVLSRDDTRGLARHWMVQHVPAGSAVVVDPLVPDRWLHEPPGRRRVATVGGDRWRPFNFNEIPASPGTVVAPLLADAATRALGARPARRTQAAIDAAVVRLTVSLLPYEIPKSVLPGPRPKNIAVQGGEDYPRNLVPALLDVFRAEGACYVVTGSTVYDRAFVNKRRVPDAIAYYRALRREGRLVFHASPYNAGARPVKFDFDYSFDYYPLAYHRPGPDMFVYRLSGGRCG
jgi:hypothetical protein